MRKYRILKKIGSGSYGKVYKVSDHCNNIYALKKIKLPKMRKCEKKSLINEIIIQKLHNSPYIIKYYDSYVDNKSICIISEYAENGDLENFIKNKYRLNIKISNDLICKIFLQVCLGINYLHNNKIIHRDIKPSNIFLDKNYNVKIGDLGIARTLEKVSMVKTCIGTPYYMSPELFSNQYYNEKTDIWSLGCVLYELLTGKKVFEADSMHQLKSRVKYSSFRQIYIHQNKDYHYYNKILNNLLNKNMHSRMTAKDIIKEKYIRNKANIEPEKFMINKNIWNNINLVPLIPKKTIMWNNVINEIQKINIGDNEKNILKKNKKDILNIRKSNKNEVENVAKNDVAKNEVKNVVKKVKNIVKNEINEEFNTEKNKISKNNYNYNYRHKKFQYKNYNYENYYKKEKKNLKLNNLPEIIKNNKKNNNINSKIYRLQKISNDNFSIDQFMEEQYKLHIFLNGNNNNKIKNLNVNISEKKQKFNQKLEPLSPKNIKNIKNFVKKWSKSPMNIIKKLRSPKKNIYYKHEKNKNKNVNLLNYDSILNYGFKISYKTEYNSRFSEF